MIPHGVCLLWSSRLIAMHIAADATVALAYFGIPLILWRIRRAIESVLGRRLLLFGAMFITLCGLTHVMEIIVVWWPLYELQGGVKLATAVVSMATLWQLVALVIATESAS